MHASVGMLSLAVQHPSIVVDNAAIRARAPALVRRAEEKTLARLWAGQHKSSAERGVWSTSMEPFLDDAFRGTVERRHITPGTTALELEVSCAREALALAGEGPIDLVIGVSFLADQLGVGNATALCRALDLRCAAFNVESACAGALVGFQAACGLVAAGQHERVLVFTSCTYSRTIDPEDTFGWFLGDGAAAFVVGRVPTGSGLLAHHAVHTGATCGAFRFDVDDGRVVLRAHDKAGQLLAAHQDDYVRETVRAALAKAQVGTNDIAAFVCNTPTAWFHRYFARVLDVDPAKVVTTYPRVANTGPVLLPGNLMHAARQALVRPGELALLFSIGSVASATSAVVRWHDVALGRDPLVV